MSESKLVVTIHGLGAAPGCRRGRVRVARSPETAGKLQPGEILVCRLTLPEWVPYLTRANAIVTDQGGRLCHAAIVAREFGIPAVVGVEGATRILCTGQLVEVDGTAGEIRVLDTGLLIDASDN